MPTGLRVPERLSPAYSLLLAAFVIALDYPMAPAIDMPGMYLLPVIYAATFTHGVCDACMKEHYT